MRRWWRLLALCSAVIIASCSGSSPGYHAGPSILVQLSDLHINRWATDRRLEDLESLSQHLLSAWLPDKVIITGDMVDAKRPSGHAEQQKTEWREYKRLWRQVSGQSGTDILDVRGNHDAFDNRRGGAHDYYTAYGSVSSSAAPHAAASRGVARVHLDPVYSLPQRLGSKQQAGPHHAAGAARVNAWANEGISSSTWSRGSSMDLLFSGAHAADLQDAQQVHHLRGRLLQSAGRHGADAQHTDANEEQAPCPTVILVSFDATPDPGLRAPTNFLGVVHPWLLAELSAKLRASQQHMAAKGCSPAYIAYGHHISTTLTYPSGTNISTPGAGHNHIDSVDDAVLAAASAAAGQQRSSFLHPHGHVTLEGVLVQHGVHAYLAGHLHDTFGFRLQKLHPPYANGRHLAELALADWKYSRVFRVMTMDQGHLGFADLRFVRDLEAEGDAEEPFSVESVSAADGRSLNTHLVLITSPPDARYAALQHARTARGGPLYVRALLLPLGADPAERGMQAQRLWAQQAKQDEAAATLDLAQAQGSNVHSNVFGGVGSADAEADAVEHAVLLGEDVVQPRVQVEAEVRWQCSQGPAMGHASGSAPMTRVLGQPPARLLFEVLLDPDAVRACALHEPVSLRVAAWTWELTDTSASVSDSDSTGVDTSQQQHVAQTRSPESTSEHRPVWLEGPAQPLPLRLSLSEYAIMHVRWESFARFTFTLMWTVLAGALLLTRLAPRLVLSASAAVARVVWPGWSGAGLGPPTSSMSNNNNNGPNPDGLISAASAAAATMAAALDALDVAGTAGGPCGSSHGVHAAEVPVSCSSSSMYVAPSVQGHAPLHSMTSGGMTSSGGSTTATGSTRNKQQGQPQQLLAARRAGACGHALSAVVRPISWTSHTLVVRPTALFLYFLIQPFKDLARVAYIPELWNVLMLYVVYLYYGPWFLACFLSGEPLSIFTPHGIYLWEADRSMAGGSAGSSSSHHTVLGRHGNDQGNTQAGYRLSGSCDMPIITNVHFVTCIGPVVLWTASVVSWWSDAAASCRLSSSRILTTRQALVMFGLMALHANLMKHLVASYGASAVLLSPGCGWVVPLTLVWLRQARARAIKARMD